MSIIDPLAPIRKIYAEFDRAKNEAHAKLGRLEQLSVGMGMADVIIQRHFEAASPPTYSAERMSSYIKEIVTALHVAARNLSPYDRSIVANGLPSPFSCQMIMTDEELPLNMIADISQQAQIGFAGMSVLFVPGPNKEHIVQYAAENQYRNLGTVVAGNSNRPIFTDAFGLPEQNEKKRDVPILFFASNYRDKELGIPIYTPSPEDYVLPQ